MHQGVEIQGKVSLVTCDSIASVFIACDLGNDFFDQPFVRVLALGFCAVLREDVFRFFAADEGEHFEQLFENRIWLIDEILVQLHE